MTQEDRRLKDTAGEIEALLDQIESLKEPKLREVATGVVQDLLALYGEGLARTLTIIRAQCSDEESDRIFGQLAEDDLVSHLLLLHDLHPVDLRTRVERALDGVRPYLSSHGGNVELLAVENGVATLRLEGSCHGCPGSTITLKHTIEEAIHKAAPDLEAIETEGVKEPVAEMGGFVPLGSVLRAKPAESLAG